jgi:hypothetical protein
VLSALWGDLACRSDGSARSRVVSARDEDRALDFLDSASFSNSV